MNLSQITDKLNSEFIGTSRKLVFWYDEKAEFVEDIESLELANAKLYHLEKDKTFFTKHFLEVVDKTTNYLVYAPFPKSALMDNHLADTLLYSKEFFADRISLIIVELKIREKFKPIIQKYSKFFNADSRLTSFEALQIESYYEDIIETGIMSVLCKIRTADFDEVLRSVITDDITEGNKLLKEFERFGILLAFWSLCEKNYGYRDEKPTLEKLLITLLITYTDHYFDGDLPQTWQPFISVKKNDIAVFIGNLMNNVLYRERYNEIASHIAVKIKASEYISKMQIESFINCDTFEAFDEAIIDWIITRLLEENVDAKVNKKIIPDIWNDRIKNHYGEKFHNKFQLLHNSFWIIYCALNYESGNSIKEVIDHYIYSDCLIDAHYRDFYNCYDKLENAREYEALRELTENIYTNEYLADITVKWSSLLSSASLTALPFSLQNNFYNQHVKPSVGKERIIVIISDALRYECANELSGKFDDDVKCEPSLEWTLGSLPSYTKLGMAALLPHKSITMDENNKITVDNLPCDSQDQRQKILQSYSSDSVCASFDDICKMKREEIRNIFTGKNIVYIYHNQIDARGDKQNSENEVFNACDEAINEIYKLVKRLTEDVSAVKYIITSDHGFIYKRDKLSESDKVNIPKDHELILNKRFLLSNKKIDVDGTVTFSMDYILGENSNKFVTVPKGADIFKVAGGGQNYVHGGASLQEMLIPILKVKTAKGKMETVNAEITMISLTRKITNLITYLEFLQVENIRDAVKATTFKLFFISEDGEKVSNENIINADKKDSSADKRTFKEKFTFKNKKYDRNNKHFLVVIDEKTDLELSRYEFIIDIAFSDDFGF